MLELVLGLLIITAIVSIALAVIALMKKELSSRAMKLLLSLFVLCIILLFTYAIYEENRICSHKLDSFKNSKELICKFQDVKIIISQDNNYILKGEYFIKDKVAIDVYKCKVLLDN